MNARSFFAGSIASMATLSLFQDALGREAYQRYAAEHWTPAAVSLPIAILALVGAAFLAFEKGLRR